MFRGEESVCFFFVVFLWEHVAGCMQALTTATVGSLITIYFPSTGFSAFQQVLLRLRMKGSQFACCSTEQSVVTLCLSVCSAPLTAVQLDSSFYHLHAESFLSTLSTQIRSRSASRGI